MYYSISRPGLQGDFPPAPDCPEGGNPGRIRTGKPGIFLFTIPVLRGMILYYERNNRGEGTVTRSLLFLGLLALTAALGGGLGAVFSLDPGDRRRLPLHWAAVTVCGCGLFLAGLLLTGPAGGLRAALDLRFPDRLSKLAGCGLLLGLLCGIGFLWGLIRARGLGAYCRRVSGSRLHRRAGLVLLVSLPLLALGCAVLAGDPPPTTVRLSEVCCANFSLLADPDNGEYADYIELCNTGSAPVDLEGCYLSNRAKKRSLYRLPARTLEPGEVLLLWADGAGTSGADDGAALHLNFSLSSGDTVWLSSRYGTLLDSVTLPEPAKNIAMVRDGADWLMARGSPGRPNEDPTPYVPATLAAPVLSRPAGFYDAAFELTITAAPGCSIHYTLNGSVPTVNSPAYTGPLLITDICGEPNRVVSQPNTTADRSGAVTEPVDKGTVLRAAAFDESGARSGTVTAVYFVGDFSAYAGKAVLSLVAAPNDLFGNYGICVTGLDYDTWLEAGGTGYAPTPNYEHRGPKWEREAALTLWGEDGSLLMDTGCGIRIQGASSRARAVKRFTCYARPYYGVGNTFSLSLFGAYETHSFCTRANPSDVMAQALSAGLGLGGQASIPAVVFLNGERYDDTYLRERYDGQYFRTHFGVEPEELIVISDDLLEEGTEADYADYQTLMTLIRTSDCADPAVWAEIRGRMDVENYARFVAFNLYLNNFDWSIYKNCRLWRCRTGGGEGVRDGRWRWLVYDMDACYWTRAVYGDAERASYDIFRYKQPVTGDAFLEMAVFSDLLKNPEFRALFIREWLELMNGPCSYESALPFLEQYGLTEDAFWPEFLQRRPLFAVDLLCNALDLEGTSCRLALRAEQPEGGTVKVDGAAAGQTGDGTRTVTWLTGFPLTLTAEPAPGWRFVGWEGIDAEGPNVTLTPDGDLQITAIFERTP